MNWTKIFGIGMPHTGTTSVHDALLILGIKSRHSPPLNRRDVAKLDFSACDAFWDVPVHSMFREIDAVCPGAKFIFTTRDMESWINSWAMHELHARITGRDTKRDINTQAWRKEWREHHESVLNHFKDRPEDILTMDLADGDGWDKLCPFIGADVPPVAFPMSNTSVDKMRQLIDHQRQGLGG